METPIFAIRKDRKDPEGNVVSGLRKWEKHEFTPRKDDVFQERLYAIRYVKEYVDEKGRKKTERYYISPTEDDLKREIKVIELLSERFNEWQEKGYIPSMMIEEGYNTDQPIRERGWQYWHQLFNPRQLLVNGLFAKNVMELSFK
jgi:putative DNA methylase